MIRAMQGHRLGSDNGHIKINGDTHLHMMYRTASSDCAMRSRGKIIMFGIDKLAFNIQQAIGSGKALTGYTAQMPGFSFDRGRQAHFLLH